MAKSRPRLTSVSGFGFGAGWDWVPADAEIVRRLLVFLEDRRALTREHDREDVGHVVQSVLRIREELTKTLQDLAPNSGATQALRGLRDACLTFLDRTPPDPPEYAFDPEFIMALSHPPRRVS